VYGGRQTLCAAAVSNAVDGRRKTYLQVKREKGKKEKGRAFKGKKVKN